MAKIINKTLSIGQDNTDDDKFQKSNVKKFSRNSMGDDSEVSTTNGAKVKIPGGSLDGNNNIIF